MKFSDFLTRVFDQLHEGYGWAAPWAYIVNRLHILDIIQSEYCKEHREDIQDWTARVEITALECDGEK